MHYDPHVKDMIDERVAGGYRSHGSPTGLLQERSGDIYDHRAAWEALEGLLSSGIPVEYASEGRSLLILGAGGSGKTHLLQAFRRHVHYRELGAYAYLKLSACVDSTGRILLGEMIDSLEQPYRESSSAESTLRRISNALVADPSLVDPELIARFRSEADEDDARRLANRISNKLYLNSERFLEVDPDLLKALIYLQKDAPLIQMLVSRYLRCEVLGNLDRRVLGDIVSRTEDGDPKGMVEHLGRVTWALLGGPLVIGVDQDDPDIDREVLRRGLRFVSDITDRLPTSVVVVACRSETWRDQQGFLPRLVVRRLENDPVPVSVRVRKRDDQVLDLVKDRMQLLNAAFQRRVARRDPNESIEDGFDGAAIRHLFTPASESEARNGATTPSAGALIRAADADVATAGKEVTEFRVPALDAPEFDDGLSISEVTTTVADGDDANALTAPEAETPTASLVALDRPDTVVRAPDEDLEFDLSAWIEEPVGPDALVIEPTSIVAPEAIVSLEELFLDPMDASEDATNPTSTQAAPDEAALQTNDATPGKDEAESVRGCLDAVARMNAQWAAFSNRRRPRAPISSAARQDLLAWALQASGAELPRPMRVAVQKHDQGLAVTIENRSTTKHALVCLCDEDAESGELTRKIRKIAGSANGHAVTLLRTAAFPASKSKGASVVRRQQAAGWRTDIVDEATLQDLRAVRGFVEAHADDPALPRWLISEQPLLGKRFLSELLVGPADPAGDLPGEAAMEPAVVVDRPESASPSVGPLEALALSTARAAAAIADMDVPVQPLGEASTADKAAELPELPSSGKGRSANAMRHPKKGPPAAAPTAKGATLKAAKAKAVKSKAPVTSTAKSKSATSKSVKSKSATSKSVKSKSATSTVSKSKSATSTVSKSKSATSTVSKSKARVAKTAKPRSTKAKVATPKAVRSKVSTHRAPKSKAATPKGAAATGSAPKALVTDRAGAKEPAAKRSTSTKTPTATRRVAASERRRRVVKTARRGA